MTTEVKKSQNKFSYTVVNAVFLHNLFVQQKINVHSAYNKHKTCHPSHLILTQMLHQS